MFEKPTGDSRKESEKSQKEVKTADEQSKQRRKLSSEVAEDFSLPKELEKYKPQIEKTQSVLKEFALSLEFKDTELSKLFRKKITEFADKIPKILIVIYEKIIKKNKANKIIPILLSNLEYFFTEEITTTEYKCSGMYKGKEISINPEELYPGTIESTLIHEMVGHGLSLGEEKGEYGNIQFTEGVAQLISHIVTDEINGEESEVPVYDPFEAVTVILAALSDRPIDQQLIEIFASPSNETVLEHIPPKYKHHIQEILTDPKYYIQSFQEYISSPKHEVSDKFHLKSKKADFPFSNRPPTLQELKKLITDEEDPENIELEDIVEYAEKLGIEKRDYLRYDALFRCQKILEFLSEEDIEEKISEEIFASKLLPLDIKFLSEYFLKSSGPRINIPKLKITIPPSEK